MSLSLVERIRSEMAGVNRWNADTRGTLLFECLEAFAARAEGDPAAEGDIPSIIERGQTGERLSPTEQSAWTGYELGWKDGLKHAISDLGECFECGHDLNGPYCPACNSDIDAARAEGVAALQQPPVEAVERLRLAIEGQDYANSLPSPPATAGTLRLANKEVDSAARHLLAALQQAGEPVAINREEIEELAEDAFYEGWRDREARPSPMINSRGCMRTAWRDSNARDAILAKMVKAAPLPQQTALVEQGVEE